MNARILTAVIFVALSAATSANDAREQAAPIIAQIQRADYEGDRAAMQRGYDELKPFTEDEKFASRIRYWRGFAQWRRAINGFNDAVDPKELARDLNTALDEFKAAIELDPKFVDAKVGIISSLGFLLFADPRDEAHKMERVQQILATEKEANAMAPDNPRLIWCAVPSFGIPLPNAVVGRTKPSKIISMD